MYADHITERSDGGEDLGAGTLPLRRASHPKTNRRAHEEARRYDGLGGGHDRIGGLTFLKRQRGAEPHRCLRGPFWPIWE